MLAGASVELLEIPKKTRTRRIHGDKSSVTREYITRSIQKKRVIEKGIIMRERVGDRGEIRRTKRPEG